MELNREQIKKELVLLIDDMPVELHLHRNRTSKFLSFLKLVLDIITTDEQKIFELENRLKECENGYEGTLYLERCKLHDAEEKVKELSEENASLNASYTELERKCASLNDENERLKSEVSVKKKLLDKCVDLEDKVKADTVTELVAGVKGILEFDIALTEEETEYIKNRIDEFAKEMLEVKNENND